MKKLMMIALLMTSAAQAYLVPGNGDGHHKPHPPHPQPAPYPGNPYEPGPSDPYYPSPGYSDYGPARTIRWKDMGTSKVDKVVGETIRIRVNGRLVNEVLLRSTYSDTTVTRAVARLSSGRSIQLPTGTIRDDREARIRLDRHYSVRVESIEITAVSRNVLDSSARLQIYLGLAE